MLIRSLVMIGMTLSFVGCTQTAAVQDLENWTRRSDEVSNEDLKMALEGLGVSLNPFEYHAPRDGMLRFTIKSFSTEKGTTGMGRLAVHEGINRVLLAVRQKDDDIYLNIGTNGSRFGTNASIDLNPDGFASTHTLIAADLSKEGEQPIFVYCVNDDSIESGISLQPIEDIIAGYEQVVVVYASLE